MSYIKITKEEKFLSHFLFLTSQIYKEEIIVGERERNKCLRIS